MVAVVVLFGVVAVASVGILVATSDVQSEAERQAEIDRAQGTFEALGKAFETTSISDDGRRFDVSTFGEDVTVDPDAGWMSVEINAGGTRCRVLDEQALGAVVYENGGTQIAYQGGGVWRSEHGSSSMVSSPLVQFSSESRNEHTFTLPVKTIDGVEKVDGELRIDHVNTVRTSPSGPDCAMFEDESVIDDGQVEVTVQSAYYRAWGRFLERKSDGSVTYDHANETVTVVVVDLSRDGDGLVPGVIWSDASTFDPTNNAAMDSYNSLYGPYSAPGDGNSNVVVRGNFQPNSYAAIHGDVRAGGDATISNTFDVTGDVIVAGESTVSNDPVFGGIYATGGDMSATGGTFEDDVIVGGSVPSELQQITIAGDLHVGGHLTIPQNVIVNGSVYVGGNVVQLDHSTIDGDVHVGGDATIGPGTTIGGDLVVNGTATVDGTATIGGTQHSSGAIAPTPPPVPEIPELESVYHNITDKGTALDSSNNNSDTSAITSRNLGPCSPTCTLEAGSYYLDELVLLGSEKLVFDASDGDIEVYVDGSLGLNDGSEIEVVGDGRVEIYLNENFDPVHNALVTVDGDRAPQFWVYMKPGKEAKFSGTTSFTGVIYGPGEDPQNGNVQPQHHRVRISVSNDLQFYGALIGHVKGTQNNNEIHFDEALTMVNAEGEFVGPQHLYLNVEVHEVVVGTN